MKINDFMLKCVLYETRTGPDRNSVDRIKISLGYHRIGVKCKKTNGNEV